jgi:phenylalanine-4-hydroxylase
MGGMSGVTTGVEAPRLTTLAGEPPGEYWERRREIASLATGVDAAPAPVDYTPVEDAVWSSVSEALAGLWDRNACAGLLAARDRLALPVDHVPQLGEVDARLRPLTGFGYRAVAGLLPVAEFFGALARGIFPSTQYLRWEGDPLYTPEPDIVHEVIGHGHALACPQTALLHRLAGQAIGRVSGERSRKFIADVFWFSAEFGVVSENGRPTAYGAGLLSSPGELAWFGDHAHIRPLDIAAMGTTAYDIDHYQPVLFGGESLDHVVDVVGGFFATATDRSIERLLEGA